MREMKKITENGGKKDHEFEKERRWDKRRQGEGEHPRKVENSGLTGWKEMESKENRVQDSLKFLQFYWEAQAPYMERWREQALRREL